MATVNNPFPKKARTNATIIPVSAEYKLPVEYRILGKVIAPKTAKGT